MGKILIDSATSDVQTIFAPGNPWGTLRSWYARIPGLLARLSLSLGLGFGLLNQCPPLDLGRHERLSGSQALGKPLAPRVLHHEFPTYPYHKADKVEPDDPGLRGQEGLGEGDRKRRGDPH